MFRSALTRRHLFALSAATGASALLVDGAALAADSRPRAFALDVTVAQIEAGVVLRAPSRFDLVGASGIGSFEEVLQLRARRDSGRWSRWVSFTGCSHRPDGVRGHTGSEPVWTGPADELQLRAQRPLRGGVTLRFIAVPERPVIAAARVAQAGGPAITPRSSWAGSAARPRGSAAYGAVELAFVHHTVNANSYGPTDSAAIVLAIALYHISSNGWKDIGYNFLVDRYGQIFEGRAGGIDRAVIGAQAGGWNSLSTGVAIIGSFEGEPAPVPAIEAVARLLAWKLPLHGAPVSGQLTLTSRGGSANRWAAGQAVTFDRISGHRDGSRTGCPGSGLYGQLPDLRARAAALAPASAGLPTAAAVVVAIDRPPNEVVYGQQLVVAGTVTTPDGAAAPGATVVIQKRGQSRWVTVGVGTSDPSGRFQIGAPWRASGVVRARIEDAGGTVAVSAEARVSCLPVLSARVVSARIMAGSRAQLTGTVRPAGRVTIAITKRGSDGAYRWVERHTVAASASGRYRALITLRNPGLYRLTARTVPAGGGRAVTAAPVFVRVRRR